MAQHAHALVSRRPFSENLATWANGVTLLRTLGGLILFSIAAISHNPYWNLAGLALYWLLDCLDGFLARVLSQETQFGAQLDILSDRFLMAFFYLNYLSMHPDLVVVIALFLFEFMVIDHYLSNQFLRWRLLSPNYFFMVDRPIWWLNWSAPGKFFNSGVVTILLLSLKSAWVVWPVLVGLYILKIYSCFRMHRLPAPTP